VDLGARRHRLHGDGFLSEKIKLVRLGTGQARPARQFEFFVFGVKGMLTEQLRQGNRENRRFAEVDYAHHRIDAFWRSSAV
jgi:hypothetical protein